MEHIYFCPGKIKIKGAYGCWYCIDNTSKETFCESCVLKYGNLIQNKQLWISNREINKCYWQSDGFKDSSALINNIRISIVDRYTLYRYKMETYNNINFTVNLPNKSLYMILLENCDTNVDSRISVGNIMHGDEYNFYDPQSKKNKILIPFMSHSSDLVFDENNINKNTLHLTIYKWIKCNDEFGSFYGLYKSPINITIDLIRNDNEINKIKKTIQEFNNYKNDKITIIDNYLD